MVFSSVSNYSLNPTPNWNNQQQVNHHQVGSTSSEVHDHPRPPHIPLFPPPAIQHQGIIRPGSMTDQARMANMPIPETVLKCPRCASMNTKFCYYNNYNLSQPRYFCKNCRRYWTQGGALRNVPVGGGCRRNKRSSSKGGTSSRSKSPVHSGSTPSNSSGCSSGHQLICQPPVSFMAPLNHLSEYSIADIGANYPGLIHQVSSSPDHFNLLLGNVVSTMPNSNSGMDPWRFIHQHHHHPSFFDANLEVPLRGTTPLYGVESHATATESVKHKLLSSTGTGADAQAQLDLLKVERISENNGIGRGVQLMTRPHQNGSFLGFQGENSQYNWSGASENTSSNNNSNSSTGPTIAWTDLISGFSSSSTTTLNPS